MDEVGCIQLQCYCIVVRTRLCDDVDQAAVMALQRQLSLVASETEDDKDVIEHSSLATAGDASPGVRRLWRRTATSLSSTRSADDRAAAEKKPLMSNQLIKEEDVEVGAVCYLQL